MASGDEQNVIPGDEAMEEADFGETRSRAGSGASKSSRMSRKSEPTDDSTPDPNAYVVKNKKGTNFVTVSHKGNTVEVKVPSEDESIHGLTRKGLSNREYQRGQLRARGQVNISEATKTMIVLKHKAKIPLTFEEEYYAVIFKLILEPPTDPEPGESDMERKLKRMATYYNHLGLSCSPSLKIALQQKMDEGEELSRVEEYLFSHPVDNTRIAKAVYNNLKDRRKPLTKEPATIEVVDLETESPAPKPAEETDLVQKVKAQMQKELDELKKNQVEKDAKAAAELARFKRRKKLLRLKLKNPKRLKRKPKQKSLAKKGKQIRLWPLQPLNDLLSPLFWEISRKSRNPLLKARRTKGIEMLSSKLVLFVSKC